MIKDKRFKCKSCGSTLPDRVDHMAVNELKNVDINKRKKCPDCKTLKCFICIDGPCGNCK